MVFQCGPCRGVIWVLMRPLMRCLDEGFDPFIFLKWVEVYTTLATDLLNIPDSVVVLGGENQVCY